jgi:effector-binding domain-containing protein
MMAQQNPTTPATEFKIEIREMDEIHMVYYNYTGSYQHCFDDFPKLMAYIQQNNIPMGKYSLGLFYDDPDTVPEEKLRSEPGYMVQGPVKTSGIYKYKKIPASKVVSTRYKSMDQIMPAYAAIGKYIAENKLETQEHSMEIYYSYDETTVDAEIVFFLKE